MANILRDKKKNNMTLRCKICSDNNIDVCWPTIYDKKINLYYCNNCNHGFLNPYFTKDELENFYKKDYRKIFFFNIPFKNTKKSVEKMSIDTGQLKESEDRAKFIVSNVKDKSHVVDIVVMTLIIVLFFMELNLMKSIKI